MDEEDDEKVNEEDDEKVDGEDDEKVIEEDINFNGFVEEEKGEDEDEESNLDIASGCQDNDFELFPEQEQGEIIEMIQQHSEQENLVTDMSRDIIYRKI